MNAAYGLLATALALAVYAFAGYPALLWVLARLRPRPTAARGAGEPPSVTVTVPVHNEEDQIEGLLASLEALEYPPGRLHILIVSDGSTDRTNELVRSRSGRGVRLLPLPRRVGKTAAEAAAAGEIRTELVLNTDASVRLHPRALLELVEAFADPDVGVASGRDISVAAQGSAGNEGEGGYVGYEMAVRALETKVSGIVGASGSCYAILASLHRLPIAGDLSRDFAAALRAHEHGYRAVSVDDAICTVPRASSLRREYRRKVRTMVRGMRTLAAHGGLLNPLRHGLFAWMLWSHKVARWALPWAGLAALGAFGALWPLAALALAAALAGLAAVAWLRDGRVPRVLGIPAWAVLSTVAAIHAALRAPGAGQSAIWEPTRRDAQPTAEAT